MDVFFLFPGRFYFDLVVVIGFPTDEGLYRAKSVVWVGTARVVTKSEL
jgi:hypothetical protein